MNQQKLLDRARCVMPAAGTGNFDPDIIIREGRGSRVWDEDNNEYIDYLIGSGPMILGHGHPEVIAAVTEQLGKGMTFFAQNAHCIELAEEICRVVPCAEQVRYASTGTEADMYAIRLARAFTNRDKIVKFEGGYHGAHESVAISVNPAVNDLTDDIDPVRGYIGQPEGILNDVVILPFNDLDVCESKLREYKDSLACVIMEPVISSFGYTPLDLGFLTGIRNITEELGILLVFDEVQSLRISSGGAQQHFGVIPDLTAVSYTHLTLPTKA